MIKLKLMKLSNEDEVKITFKLHFTLDHTSIETR